MDHPLKIGICAVDTGSKNVCALVKGAANAAEFELFEVPGLSLPATAPVVREIRDSVAMICGCSDQRPEAASMIEAMKENPSILPVFVEDFPNTAGNFLALPNMQELIRKGAYACTILPDNNEALKNAGFKDVVTVGLPDHWTDSVWQMQQGRLDRKERKILRKGNPVLPEDILIYVVGLKNPTLETEILRELYAHASIAGRNVSVAFRAHPGEKRRMYEEEFKRAADVRNVLVAGQYDIEVPGCPVEQLNDRMTGAADIVILNPGSTTQYPAMALEGGTLLLTTRALVEEQERNDNRRYEEEASRMFVVEKTEDLADAIETLLNPNSPEHSVILAKQKSDQLTINPAQKKFGTNVLKAIKRWTRH